MGIWKYSGENWSCYMNKYSQLYLLYVIYIKSWGLKHRLATWLNSNRRKLWLPSVEYCNTITCRWTNTLPTKPLSLNRKVPLQWRHNGRDSVSNHQPHDCLLNRWFRRRSKRTSKLRVTGLCVGNSPVNSPHKWQCNAENVSIWWRHHANDTLVAMNNR